MTSIVFEVNGTPYEDYVLRADIWREAANGIGRWEVILDPRGGYWPGIFAVDNGIEIQINASLMMLGYIDDIKPFRESRDISGYSVARAEHTGLWKLVGRDYGMDLAQFYFTAAAGNYQYTRADDLVDNVLASLVVLYGVGNPEITYASPAAAPRINYDWAPRTYLADGFREVAELVDYDFYVQDNAARTLHFFDIATMNAGAEHTAVDLYEFTGVAPTASLTPILEIEVGESLGFKQKNFVEVHAGFLDDHWTEVQGNSAAPAAPPEWLAGPSSLVLEEFNIFLNGKGAIYCEQTDALNWMYARLPIPVGNDPKAALDLRDESHIRYLTYQEDTWDGVGVLFDCVCPALVDNNGNVIVYQLTAGGVWPQDYKYTNPLPTTDWVEIRVPIGQDSIIGGWFPAWQWWVNVTGVFNWANVVEIRFTTAQNTLAEPAGWFIIDGLQIPSVEAISLSRVAGVPGTGYRMKHFYRPDIKDQYILDITATKLRDQYRYSLETVNITSMGQVLSKYAGQSLDVVAPAFGIGGPLITNVERHRIFRLHHSVVRNSAESNIPGFTYLTDYELIKQDATVEPQLVNPMRVQFDTTPTESMIREFRLEQKYRLKEKYRQHL